LKSVCLGEFSFYIDTLRFDIGGHRDAFTIWENEREADVFKLPGHEWNSNVEQLEWQRRLKANCRIVIRGGKWPGHYATKWHELWESDTRRVSSRHGVRNILAEIIFSKRKQICGPWFSHFRICHRKSGVAKGNDQAFLFVEFAFIFRNM
jgi:hypothetical protein